MMKHLKHLFTAMLLLCSTVASAHEFEVNGFYYNITNATNNTVEVTFQGDTYDGYSNEYTGSVVIPASVTYNGNTYSVTSIGDYAFYGCTGLTSVTIPNSVKSIGEEAFYGCTGLTSITIPNSVTSIRDYAFADCSSLTNLHIEDGDAALSFGSYGNSENGSTRFSNCPLVTLYLGRNLSYYYNEYDYGTYTPFCNKTLKSVTIGNRVTSIGQKLFDGSSINKIIIGSSVTYIGSSYYSSLKTIINLSSLNITEGTSDNGGIAYYADVVYNNATTVGDFVFSTLNGVNYLVAYTGNEISIELPDDYNGSNYEIAAYGFSGCSQFISVEIPNSVTSIGYYAFSDCIGLHSVTIGSSVLSIQSTSFPSGVEKFIFLGNTPPRRDGDYIYKPSAEVIYVSNATTYGFGIEYQRLSSMFEVDGVKYVPLSTKECDVIDCCYDASAANVVVDSVVLYKNRKMTVKNINDYSFYNNNYIKHAFVNNDGYVGEYAFYDCDSIAGDLTVENNGYVGGYAFYSCDKLTNAKVANNGYIGNSAFRNSFTECDGGGVVNISNPSYIGSSAFKGCTGLVTANVQNSGNVLSNAFQDCVSMQNLTLGENVGSLGSYAFDNCSSLKAFSIPDNVPSMGSYCFSNCTSLQKMAVGTGIEQLSTGTFKNCTSLTDMSIGINVDSIFDKVFYNCSSLPVINIPEATKHVYDSVFYDCKSLAVVAFENRADSIVLGSNGKSPMFSSCPLDSVYVGGRLKYGTTSTYGYSPFYGNKYLRSVTYNDVETTIYDKEYMGCSNLQNVALGNGVKTIGVEAFRNCTALPRITTPNSVTTMGKFAFAGCRSLVKAVIGNGTQAINESTFRNCASLVDIKLGTSIGSIGASSFYNCSALPEITIPKATTSIADSVFYNCSGLARFYAEDGSKTLSLGKNAKNASSGSIGDACPLFIHCQLDSVYLGRNISYNQTQEYGYSPFYFNKTLRAVVIGDSVKSVFPNEFYQCRKLEYVSVGNGVTSVGDWAFSSCVSLDHFSFGVGLETIGKEAFSDCTLVTKIISSRDVPPVCGDQALADIDMWECTVYVPEDYIDAYMAADQWCDFWIDGAEYKLRFFVDDEVYSESMVMYNAEIELPTNPEKEGHTFIGWRLPENNCEMPERMPAYDADLYAVFEVNNYTIAYIVDGEEYDVETIAYGSVVVPVEAPEKDGYTFNRWETLPQTMPAENIEVVAVYDEIPTEVTITIGQYGSTVYSSPYALDFSSVEGLKAYTATGYNTSSGVITMTKSLTSGAGVGLYLLAEPGTYIVPIIESSDDNSLNMLVGNLEKSVINSTSDDGLYANYKYTIKSGDAVPKFYQYGDNSSISAGKAYLQIPLDWIGSNASKAVDIRFDNGETTDIEDMESDNGEVKAIYDLNGCKLNEITMPGVYIIDGKKVFVE